MSWRLVDHLLDTAEGLDSAAKLVLLKLARHADDQGLGARPSQREIARASGRQVRQVRNILAGLERDGWIRKERQGSQHRTSSWSVASAPGVFPSLAGGRTRAAIPAPERQPIASQSGNPLPQEAVLEAVLRSTRAREKQHPLMNLAKDEAPPATPEQIRAIREGRA